MKLKLLGNAFFLLIFVGLLFAQAQKVIAATGSNQPISTPISTPAPVAIFVSQKNFNGTSDFLTLNSAFKNGKPFTVSAWVRFTDIKMPENYLLWNNYGLDLRVGYQRVAFGFLPSPKGSSYTVLRFTPTDLQGQKWRLVTFVYDGQNQLIYLDDKLLGSQHVGAMETSHTASTMYIGRTNTGAYYKGDIQEMNFYDTAISQTKVQSNFQFTKPQ